MAEQYTPKANVAKELSEISKDFTHPRELVRETISNSVDASASQIWIEAVKDDSRGEDELVVRIIDDGVGMDKETLEGFFDLGFSTKRNQETAIGQKGHGTKITYNSARVVVYSRSLESMDQIWCAILDDPKRQLTLAIRNNANPPVVSFEAVATTPNERFNRMLSGTLIEVRGYDNNNWSAFAHGPLKDFVQWFTAWGRIDAAWGGKPNPPCRLFLKGLGETSFEEIPYGHPFPPENYDFRSLRGKDDRRPENHFVRRWVSDEIPVRGHPTVKIQIVFSVEGDSAKRDFNQMLKRLGKQPSTPFAYNEYRYNVSDRYGVYFCKDFIPIVRKNENFTQTSEWTKWHAFVNCQSFSLTANRSNVENTPSVLLEAIKETALAYIEDNVIDSDEYADFRQRMKIEEGRRKAEKEKRDVKRRLEQSGKKPKYSISFGGREMTFREPRTEQGALWLLAKIATLWPDKFPWLEQVLDLDQHFGYDLLVYRRHQLTAEPDPAFVEIKHELRDSDDFNHSFDYLSTIICWDTKIAQDMELFDIQKHKRVFKIAPPNEDRDYTKCFLSNPDGGSNIEVVVLRSYLEESLKMKRQP